MRKTVVIVFTLAVIRDCFADSPAPQAPQGLYCGEIPESIYSCIDGPKVVTPDIATKCKRSSECESMKCIFAEAGWLDGTKINKKKVKEYFEKFAVEHAAWTPAVNHVKATCLGDHVLPAQGVHLNCPEYDIIHCALISFIRNATPSQWKTSAECTYPRSFAAGCPVCPSACFAPQVPYGACNACLSLPRSA